MNYFFYGKEEFNIEQEIKKLRKKNLDKNFEALNYRIFDAPKFNDLLAVLKTPPVMFGNIINVIDVNKYFFSNQAEYNLSDSHLKSIEATLEYDEEKILNIFVLTLPRKEDVSVATKKLFKILSKCKTVMKFDEYRNYDKKLVDWIIKQAKSKEMIVKTDVAKVLIEKLDVNLRILDNELEKIKLSIYPKQEITLKDIEKYSVSTENIYKIADYIIANKKDLALLEFNRNCRKQHYLAILFMLQKTFSNWIFIKMNLHKYSLAEIGKKRQMHEYVVKLTADKLSKTKLEDLIDIKKKLINAEESIKTTYSQNPELEIEKVILS